MLKLEKTKIIRDNINPALLKIGFPEIRSDDIDKGNCWSASIRQGDLIKRISIHDIYGQLRLGVNTNAYGRGTTYISKEQNGIFSGSGKIDWPYKNRQEFREIIKIFNNVIEQYALQQLEDISTPTTEIYPTKEMNLYLFEKHDVITAECIQEWGLEDKDLKDVVFYLNQKIEQNRTEEFDKMKPLLIKIASVYADMIIKNYGGTWGWNDYNNNTIIIEVGREKRKRSFNILSAVFFHWKNPQGYVGFSNIVDSLSDS